ncbi:MAG: acyl-CoA dehydrogenase, partial [Acidimicrobiales bacterium]
IAALAPRGDEASERFVRAVEDHHRYSVSATVASGSIEMQRIVLARSLLAAS